MDDKIIPDRLSCFTIVYKAKLAETFWRHPSQYPNHSPRNAVEMAEVQRDMIKNSGIRACVIDGAGWKSAAKAFGIANTYEAWTDWFAGNLTPVPTDEALHDVIKAIIPMLKEKLEAAKNAL